MEASFARGDRNAYESAYARYGARLVATARRVCPDVESARECVHDTFLNLWKRRGAYRAERGSLEAFLVVCVRNAALARTRNEGRRRHIAAAMPAPEPYEIETDPIERERVRSAVASLSDLQAEVIELAYYGGLSLREVSDRLDVPIGTVKSRASSALRALRALFGASGVNG